MPVLPPVSVAVTVSVPAVVPAVKTPVVETIEPKLVLLIDHEYVPVPPDAVKVCVPPIGTDIVAGETAIVAEIIVTVVVPVLPATSVAVIVNEPTVGPAVKAPVDGSIEPKVAPLVIDHVYVPVPPVAVKVCVPSPVIAKEDGAMSIPIAIIEGLVGVPFFFPPPSSHPYAKKKANPIIPAILAANLIFDIFIDF